MQDHPGRCLGASRGGHDHAGPVCLSFSAAHHLHVLVLPVPIWLFAIFNVAQDCLHFLSRLQNEVAVVVHLAGAAFALGYYQWQGRFTGVDFTG